MPWEAEPSTALAAVDSQAATALEAGLQGLWRMTKQRQDRDR